MKKKKTVHLRRIRKRSTNKSKRFSNLNFINIFNEFFYKNLLSSYKKSSIFKFLISFFCTNKNIILNILKKFGMNNNYKIDVKPKISTRSNLLQNKFKFLKKNTKYFINIKRGSFLKRKIYFKLKNISFNTKFLRLNNVEYKKKMTLYFSYRHLLELPVRGQRTKTNAKTRKNYNII